MIKWKITVLQKYMYVNHVEKNMRKISFKF